MITYTRNLIYDKAILTSKRFSIPLISVGNLSVGGTGKTPHVEFILSILKREFSVGMLSRGYKRKTSGFILADKNAMSCNIGDEPFQIFKKNQDCVVAVDEKRVRAVAKLTELFPELHAIVLDDAFQHRQLSVGLSVLLTCYNHLFSQDSHLPGGNLRESKKSYQRADILIITKCPLNIDKYEMKRIEARVKPASHQKLFFSGYVYDDIQPVFPDYGDEKLTLNQIKENKAGVLLVTGIVSPKPVLEKLKEYTIQIDYIFFPDHHNFNAKDIKLIEKKYNQIIGKEKLIILTEKDAARMVDNSSLSNELKSKMYFLPIRVKILDNKENELIKTITDYVTKNSGNC